MSHRVHRRAVQARPPESTPAELTPDLSRNSTVLHQRHDSIVLPQSWRPVELNLPSDRLLYTYLLRLSVVMYAIQPKFRKSGSSQDLNSLSVPTDGSHSPRRGHLRSRSNGAAYDLSPSNSRLNIMGGSYSSASAPSFGDAKLPKDFIKHLQKRFKSIALKPEKYHIDDPLLKRSYLAFYAAILSPEYTKTIKDSRRAEDVIMMYLSCSAKELNKSAVNSSETKTLLDKQGAAFVQLMIDLMVEKGLVKDYSSLVTQLNSYAETLSSNTNAQLAPQQSSLAPPMSHIALSPTFELQEMDVTKDVGSLLLVANSELQADVNQCKDKADARLIIHELKRVERNLRDYNKHSVYTSLDFASTADFDIWKDQELASITQIIASYSRTIGAGSPILQSVTLANDDFYFIPPDPVSYYSLLVKRCLERDLSLADKEHIDNPEAKPLIISKPSTELLQRVANLWRIPHTTRSSILIKFSVDMFKGKAFNLATLRDTFSLAESIASDYGKASVSYNKIPGCDKYILFGALRILQETLIEEIGSSLSAIFEPKPPKIAPYLDCLDQCVEKYCTLLGGPTLQPTNKQIKRLKQILFTAAENKYDSLIEDIPRDHTLDPLHIVDLADKLIAIAKKLQKRYTMALFDELSIGHCCSERHLTLFSADSYSMFNHLMNHIKSRSEEPVFEDMILLYKKLVEIRELFVQVSDQPFGFNLEQNFRPYIIKWAEASANTAQSWIEPAIAQDKFLPQEEDSGRMYSSSVNDIFTAFKGAVDVVNDLGWRDAFDIAKFHTIIMKGVSAAICQYSQHLFSLFSEELNAHDEEVTLVKTRQDKWLQMAKNAVNAKEQIVPYRFMKETCVKLNDIEKAQIELDKLEASVQSEKLAQIIAKVEKIPKSNSFLFTIRIIQAEGLKACDMNGLSDPYVILVDQSTRRSIGKTRTIYEDLNPIWNESFEIATAGPKWLTATVWDENMLANHDLCGRASLRLDPQAFDDYGSQDCWLDLDTQGRLLVNISMDSERDDIRFYFGKAFRTLIRSESDMIKMIVEKFTAFIKYSISLQTLKSLQGGGMFSMETVSTWLSNTRISVNGNGNKPTAQRLNTEQMEDSLNPLFDYLNENFAIVAHGLTEDLRIKVMTQTWKVVLQTIEFLLLPPLTKSRSLQQQLSAYESDIVFTWLSALRDFFHHDGAGPSLEVLQSQRYQFLMSVPVYYDLSTAELKAESEKMSALSFKALRDRSQVAVPELIRRQHTVMAHRNRQEVQVQREKVRNAKRELPDTEDIILRILKSRGEHDYVSRRLSQRERMAQALATENMAKQAAAGNRFKGK